MHSIEAFFSKGVDLTGLLGDIKEVPQWGPGAEPQ